MKIQGLRTHNLRNDAHFWFHTEFLKLINESGADTLKVKPLLDSYQPLYEREDQALKKIVKSEFTAKIHEADKARDEIWSGMAETNATALKHFDPQVKEAAGRLQIVFDTYGNVANKPLNEETSAIYNILQELQGKYAADMEKVGITQWASELKNRNTAFDALVQGRYEEAAGKTDIVLKNARVELDEAFRAIVERVNALMVVEGVSAYEQFAKRLNVVIDKYAVKHHHHRPQPKPTEVQQ